MGMSNEIIHFLLAYSGPSECPIFLLWQVCYQVGRTILFLHSSFLCFSPRDNKLWIAVPILFIFVLLRSIDCSHFFNDMQRLVAMIAILPELFVVGLRVHLLPIRE